MAQPNIAREPSMDEILASIRRIIESNEPVIQSNIGNLVPEQESFSGVAANDDAESGDAEDVPLTVDGSFEETMALYEQQIARNEAEADDAGVVEAAKGEAEHAQGRSLSLADVAARVRAASERMQPQREPVAVAPAIEQRIAPSAPAEVAPASPAAKIENDERAERIPEPEVTVSAAAQEAPLLSSRSGAQVARSFQDLAFAVETAQRRSFDEIAAELLRPMLQEWLDDNLPTLVERLVREEIERVARGPRKP